MKKLFIDYEVCNKCPECTAMCSYRLHPGNVGVDALREKISFLFACRRCEDYPCINACPNGALKRVEGVNRRANMMCISCKSCAMACPFGTILPEYLPYTVSGCDICLGRLAEGQAPACVTGCKANAVRFVEESELTEEKHLYRFGDNVLVRVVNWLEMNELKK